MPHIQGDELLQSEETQCTVLHSLQEILPNNAFYVKRFLGEYIKTLEKMAEVDGGLYELFCDPTVLGATELPPTHTDVLEYYAGEDVLPVKIQETPRIISGLGTTGLRTWEAALYLLSFLNRSQGKIELCGKTVLELGAGTGLVSLSLLRNLARHRLAGLLVTDGNTTLLSNFGETLRLNELQHGEMVKTQQLLWGSSTSGKLDDCKQTGLSLLKEEMADIPKADIVLGADVTYDALVVPLLCETIEEFLSQGTEIVLIAATIRSMDTIKVWEKELNSRFQWTVVEKLEDPHTSELPCWFRKGTPEIRIYEIVALL